jgi:hypothetical protein
VKALTELVAWYVLLAGMFFGPPLCLALSARLVRRRGYEGKTKSFIFGASALCAAAGYAVLLAGFLYQRKYGFDFNDASIRLRFVHWGSSLSTLGSLIALFNKGSVRTTLLVSCLMLQMYWYFQVQAI